ncbi:MAG: hypothetical protein JKY37_20545 [Nannocystaceae bacterium]|nr:hypothetical protein [Nannocystaceae bacterium]
MPTLTTGRVAVGVTTQRLRGELAGTLWTPADATDARGGGARSLVTLGTVQARGCAIVGGDAVRFPLCAGLAMGALRLDDSSASGRQTAHRYWAGGTLSAAIVWRFRPYAALWFGPEVIVAFRRVSIPLAASDEVYRSRRAGVRGGLGIEFYFPSQSGRRPGNTRR